MSIEKQIIGTEEQVSKETDVKLLTIVVDTARGSMLSVIEFPSLLNAQKRLNENDKESIRGVIKVLYKQARLYERLLSQ